MTDLDAAHAAMASAPEDEGPRLRFYETLAETELFLLLEAEAQDDSIVPATVTLDGQVFVLAFDREERLARFAEQVAPQAGLSGRALAAMLAGQGLGIALNPDTAPSAMLIEAAAVDWLAQTLAEGPQITTARPVRLDPPSALPKALLESLDRKFAAATGLARAAWLARVTYDDGTTGHMLAFTGALPAAEPALARAVSEALTFSGLAAGAIDVTFLPPDDPVLQVLSRVALRFDLPDPVQPPTPRPPGSDPENPPRLR